MNSGNGRFHPEEKYTNDPDKDFPIRDKVQDFAGNEREFEITFHRVGLGYSVQAVEIGRDPGYYFRAFDPNSPYHALGRLRARMDRILSIRHLQKSADGYSPSHDVLRGHITMRDGELMFVVDGVPLSLTQLGTMAETREGFQFSLRFVDPNEEVP